MRLLWRKRYALEYCCDIDLTIPKDHLILQRILFKLFNIEEAITSSSETIVKKNKELKGLRAEQRAHDQELEEARAEQAKARGAVMQKEKAIKKADKSLDVKASFIRDVPPNSLLN